MKIALITPWDNAWVPYLRDAVERRGHTFERLKTHHDGTADIYIHGWAVNEAVPGARNFAFLRRFELYTSEFHRNDWSKFEAMFCVNTWIAEAARRVVRIPIHVIYNGTDLARWTFRERKPGPRIGMACHVHPKKNLPLALQILALLPGHTLHIAGEIQDPATAEYLNHLAKRLRQKVYLYGHVPHDQLDLWWEQMNYCLSTSISEGNPNNVIEAMAKGIKPVVHAWPGAEDQFPDYLFDTAPIAANRIYTPGYDSHAYRALVESRFSLANYDRILDLVLAS